MWPCLCFPCCNCVKWPFSVKKGCVRDVKRDVLTNQRLYPKRFCRRKGIGPRSESVEKFVPVYQQVGQSLDVISASAKRQLRRAVRLNVKDPTYFPGLVMLRHLKIQFPKWLQMERCQGTFPYLQIQQRTPVMFYCYSRK